MAWGPTKMVASICPIQRLSGLLSNRLRFPVFRGAWVRPSSTPNVAARLPAPPAINIGGEETTSLLHRLGTPMGSLSPVSFLNGLRVPTRPAIAEVSIVEPIEEEFLLSRNTVIF